MAGAQDYMTVPSPTPMSYGAGNYADLLFKMLSTLPAQYREGQDFQYKQRQQDLFQDPQNRQLLQDAIKTGDYSDLVQTIIKSGGAPAIGQIQPLLDVQAQRQFYDSLRGVNGGGTQPVNVGPESSRAAAGPANITGNFGGGQGGQPSLSATGSDSAGGESVQSLTVGIARARGVSDVSPAKMQSFAQALGVDLDTPLSATQEALARKLIGTNVRGGSAGGPTVDNGAPKQVISTGFEHDENKTAQGTPVGTGGGVPMSPPQGAGRPVGETFESRGTPIGTLADANRHDELASRYNTLASAPRISPAQAAAAKAEGERHSKIAEEIRKQLGHYNSPETNPTVKGQLSQFGKIGEAQGKVIGDYIDAGRSAYKRIQYLDTVGDALTRGHGNITTGPFADFALASKQALSSLFDIPLEGVAEAEVAKKTGFALATQAVKEITSRPTQMEVGQALQNNPGLLLSEKGSALMIDIMKQAARQDAELAKLAGRQRNWANWQDVVDKFYSDHPLMSPFDHSKPLGIADIKAIGGGAGGAGGPGGGSPKRYNWTPQGLQPQ